MSVGNLNLQKQGFCYEDFYRNATQQNPRLCIEHYYVEVLT